MVELAGELWAPLSLIGQLGGTVSGIVVIMPDRSRLLLNDGPVSQPAPAAADPAPAHVVRVPQANGTVPLANGVQALRLHALGQSVLLADLGLLALAYPDQRVAFDSFNAGLSGYRPLYFVLSAGVAGPAHLEFNLDQGSLSTRLAPEDGVVILQGDPREVGPGQPLSGILLLPLATNLRAPLQVQWLDQTMSMVFRR